MAKVQTHRIDKKERYEMIGDFYDIVTNLKTKNDVIGFFMGLLTPSEALMFARRIQIATMLLEDKSYADIQKKLKVGTSTIATVHQWLHSDNEQFKKHITAHIQKKQNSNKKPRKNSIQSHNSFLDKYPQHKMWKNLFGL